MNTENVIRLGKWLGDNTLTWCVQKALYFWDYNYNTSPFPPSKSSHIPLQTALSAPLKWNHPVYHTQPAQSYKIMWALSTTWQLLLVPSLQMHRKGFWAKSLEPSSQVLLLFRVLYILLPNPDMGFSIIKSNSYNLPPTVTQGRSRSPLGFRVTLTTGLKNRLTKNHKDDLLEFRRRTQDWQAVKP